MTLADYIADCQKRLKARFAAQGVAAIALAALAATALFALLFVTLVPSSGWVVAARVLLYASLISAIVFLIWRPVTAARAANDVEFRVPDFDGRLATWRDSMERGEDSPMLGLLTRETEAIARTEPPGAVIPAREIAIPAGIASAFVAVLLLVTTGVTPWQLAAQRLWTGDLFTAAAPRITVTPGDTVIPRGADVVIEAATSGFVARGMEMHAEFENATGPETAPMSYLGESRLGEGRYGFVFVGVTEEVEYYVGASGLNSERHVIKVADLPRVTDVSLEYTFPDWTELPVEERKDGDVAALPGTEVAITATTDAPVTDPLIVVNGEVLDADAEGLLTEGSFEVGEPGSWHVAVRHEGTLARISDTYFIDVVEDQPPQVVFSWPGHDSQATAIEERTLRFTADDDYGVQALTLAYSVNGGEWTTTELEIPAADVAIDSGTEHSEHTLYLEELEITPQIPDAEARPLRPGDMITFYAEAKDHAQDSKTSLYFVDVRPFDKTYRESQTMAGQQGGQQDGGAGELVQRQREIVSATWNLINNKTTGEGEPADSDQAEVLALLQRTLKDQVTTLIQRAGARRLTMDEEIDLLTQELTAATEDMEPAAEKLEAKELEDAIAPEQQALQHLLAAQATMTDVDVSMGSPNMRGTAGRSLSELMDLEMDQERNRYEMPQSPNLNQEAQQEDEEWQRLAELAARQEQLAQQQRMGEESLASRWQQERLQRELEKLQEELERRRRQNQQNQRGQNGQSSEAMENAIAELNQAREAIDRSLQQQGSDPEANRQASRAAADAIQRASEQLREQAFGNMDERLARTERSVENLISDQRNIMDRLDEVQDDALNARTGDERRFDDYAMEPYGERKRRMQQDLNEITREIGEVGEAISDPETSRVLEQAVGELAQERLDERLAASADAFEFGRPLYAIGNEAAVERALERLSDRLGQARRLLESSEDASGGESTLAQIRELRSQLGEALQGGAQPGGQFERQDGIGAFDTSDMEALFRRADALESRLGYQFGDEFELDTTLSREAYLERGTDAGNTEALAQLMKDRLDLIEAALVNLDAEPIRAQEPRDQERDSEAAARYFKDLSRPEG